MTSFKQLRMAPLFLQAIIIIALFCVAGRLTINHHILFPLYVAFAGIVGFRESARTRARVQFLLAKWANENRFKILSARPANFWESLWSAGRDNTRPRYHAVIRDLDGRQWEGWLRFGRPFLGVAVDRVEELGFAPVPDEVHPKRPSHDASQETEHLWDREIDG
jgi:hypothetical protein